MIFKLTVRSSTGQWEDRWWVQICIITKIFHPVTQWQEKWKGSLQRKIASQLLTRRQLKVYNITVGKDALNNNCHNIWHNICQNLHDLACLTLITTLLDLHETLTHYSTCMHSFKKISLLSFSFTTSKICCCMCAITAWTVCKATPTRSASWTILKQL